MRFPDLVDGLAQLLRFDVSEGFIFKRLSEGGLGKHRVAIIALYCGNVAAQLIAALVLLLIGLLMTALGLRLGRRDD